ncbi:Phosphorelay intermediate protein [Malassezia psittaci]|uniref:Phosphorelay intermediate protein n=1 Tax=Malassezia psittaci TaxID=1821823 RepID=A0AAF0FB52_9BASI|nr:Phosphorelay intermediate protein [Malassezia psittaci]
MSIQGVCGVLIQQDVSQGIETLPPNVIDIEVFEQLLEMDEDDQEFSRSLVYNYFEQAESTFEKMRDALASENLEELSTLGHFLKGSSAAVGVIKVRDSCEAMQHYGRQHGADGVTQLAREDAINKLTKTLEEVKAQYAEAEAILRAFFHATA